MTQTPSQPAVKWNLPTLLKTAVDQDASDLHISVGVPPEFRIQGKMVRVKSNALSAVETKDLCYSVITEHQKKKFEETHELDFSFEVRDLARFRGNLFYQKGAIAGTFRKIPIQIPDFDALGLPKILRQVIKRPNGLVLVTGPTGSGKSTTLASLLDVLNREESGHLLTIEDPIEFVHLHKNCLVSQREVGSDTLSFREALKHALRQDPDFILVGELRDLETIQMCLEMAETGHLVFGTLHTNSAISSIHRIINVFPAHQQPQIRQMLSFVLQAIVSQQLIPRSQGQGRAMACEVLIPNIAIKNLIREDKVHQIYSMMLSGQGETGMMTMNQSLTSLVKAGVLNKSDALEHSFAPEELQKILGN